VVPDESIHLTFTSPPYYNARDYSIYASYQAYLDFLTDVFREVHRITKEGRFFVLNTSPVIVPRVSRAHASTRYAIPFDIHPRLIDIGWEFIDDIIWAKPEASVKNRNGGFMQHRKPLAYKPNPVTEYVMVYRKKTDKLIDWNIRQYDDAAVDASKIKDDYESSNLWEIDPTFDRVHSAVFPIELCRRVIQFYSYVGDLVFDPFGGSGTVGRAAQGLGRHFFLTERDPKYAAHIRASLGGGLFTQTRFLPASHIQTMMEQYPMRLTDIVVQNVITKLLHGQDYRTEILALINAQFLRYVIEFFKKVVEAKLRNLAIDGDWYKREFLLDPSLSTEDMIIHAGLNEKTVANSFRSASRKVVLDVAPAYYDELYRAISALADESSDLDVTLTLRFRGVSVDLNLTETLIVINTLAVKRAQFRGGAWSAAGKRAEKALMITLCRLFSVPPAHYELRGLSEQGREVDFFLISADGIRHRCEVKLMGKGNPESADAVIARDSSVFVADTLSALNRKQLDERGIQWVKLRTPTGYQRWLEVLHTLNIPAQAFTGDFDAALADIFASLFPLDKPVSADDLDGTPA
jgi:DNA modification methylase